MFSVTGAARTAAIVLVIFVPVTAAAITLEKVTVTGSGFGREKAITSAAEAAVQAVIERYVVSGAMSQNRNMIMDEILANSHSYLESLNILDEKEGEEGFVEVTALAAVEVGRLVTSLRNLDIAVKLPTMGPNQAVEGRRRELR